MKFCRAIFIILLCFLVFIPITDANNAKQTQSLFQLEEINKIEFWFDDKDLLSKMASDYRSKKKTYFNIECAINGQKFNTTGIRFKGDHSNSFAWTDKKPLKVKINEFEDQNYQGITKFNLANAFEDPSFQRDVQSLSILRQMGVAAPLAAYAKVHLNGEYFGLYIIIEQLDQAFLQRSFGENSGPLFESDGHCLGMSSIFSLELKENKKNYKRDKLIAFTKVLHDTNTTRLFNEIESYLNVRSFLRACAVDVYLENQDSYAWGSCHNFYLYFRENGVVEWIAWDYNLSFGYGLNTKNYYPIGSDRNYFLRRLLKEEKYMEMYWQAIEEISKITSSIKYKINVLRIHKLIKSSVAEDPNKFYSLDTFNVSLKKSILGGLSTQIPGILTFTNEQNRRWKEYKKENELRID